MNLTSYKGKEVVSCEPTSENVREIFDETYKILNSPPADIDFHDKLVSNIYKIHSMLVYGEIKNVDISLTTALMNLTSNVYNQLTDPDYISKVANSAECVVVGNDIKYFTDYYNDILHAMHRMILMLIMDMGDRFYRLTLSKGIYAGLPSSVIPQTMRGRPSFNEQFAHSEYASGIIDIASPVLSDLFDVIENRFKISSETEVVVGNMEFYFSGISKYYFIDISAVPNEEILLTSVKRDDILMIMLEKYKKNKYICLPFIELFRTDNNTGKYICTNIKYM